MIYNIAMIGIDEVGRGAWAGPLLVMGARLKPGKKLPEGLRDSKKLTAKRRRELAEQILEVCDMGEGWVSPDMVDKLGLTDALKCACLLTVERLQAKSGDKIILDGNVDYFKDSKFTNVDVVPKADDKYPLVSAASIVAKVLRDSLMKEYDKEMPQYKFGSHVGYGTKAHLEALQRYGVTNIHRLSFKPVAKILKASS